MKASVIIPVWNGASVILDCLQALYQHTAGMLLEVICVDNGSADESARVIAEHYPQVVLCVQPANLGFAGGVNAGMRMAKGELFVLLNQDCLVQPGWLDHLLAAFSEHESWGIAGCTLLDAEGKVEHAGAYVRYPEVRGAHRVDVEEIPASAIDYVTGALFALRRSLWEAIGPFDEGFYPAYYEETDYCYRARHAGYDIGYVPAAQGVHLRSNQEWQRDTLLSALNQEQSRYRFIAKHLSEEQIAAFAAYELAAIAAAQYFDSVVGHAVAARRTLRHLSEILACRQQELQLSPSPQRQRLLQTTFRQILHRSIHMAQRLSLRDLIAPAETEQGRAVDDSLATAEVLALLEPSEAALASLYDLAPIPLPPGGPGQPGPDAADDVQRRLQKLRQQEYDLIGQIYFRPPDAAQPEALWQRIGRYVRRILSFVSGREFMLQSQLNAVHTARMDELQDVIQRQQQTIAVLSGASNALNERLQGSALLQLQTAKQLHRRLQLLELLTDYDYR